MDEPGGAPWVDGAGMMRVGPPPAGWQQASDGRWYPPAPLITGGGGHGPGPHTLEARPYIDGPTTDRSASPRTGAADHRPRHLARTDSPRAAPPAEREATGRPAPAIDAGMGHPDHGSRPVHQAPGRSAGHLAAGGGVDHPVGGRRSAGGLARPGDGPEHRAPAPAPAPAAGDGGGGVAGAFRAPYGDVTGERRRGGAYREPTPDEVVALLRSGEHRAVVVPPAPAPSPRPSRPGPSGEHRVTRAPMAGLVDGVRSWPLWVRVAVPVAGAVALLGAAGVVTGEPPADREAVATQNTAPPPTEAPPTTLHPTMPAPTAPPSLPPIVTAPPATSPPATDPAPAVEAPITHVHYDSCDAARAAGAAPFHEGEPGYRADLDRDGDGIACE